MSRKAVETRLHMLESELRDVRASNNRLLTRVGALECPHPIWEREVKPEREFSPDRIINPYVEICKKCHTVLKRYYDPKDTAEAKRRILSQKQDSIEKQLKRVEAELDE